MVKTRRSFCNCLLAFMDYQDTLPFVEFISYSPFQMRSEYFQFCRTESRAFNKYLENIFQSVKGTIRSFFRLKFRRTFCHCLTHEIIFQEYYSNIFFATSLFRDMNVLLKFYLAICILFTAATSIRI